MCVFVCIMWLWLCCESEPFLYTHTRCLIMLWRITFHTLLRPSSPRSGALSGRVCVCVCVIHSPSPEHHPKVPGSNKNSSAPLLCSSAPHNPTVQTERNTNLKELTESKREEETEQRKNQKMWTELNYHERERKRKIERKKSFQI